MSPWLLGRFQKPMQCILNILGSECWSPRVEIGRFSPAQLKESDGSFNQNFVVKGLMMMLLAASRDLDGLVTGI